LKNEPVSRLVLGGASLGKLRTRDAEILLSTARGVGITRIDTAPGYGESENTIGNILNGKDTFTVNTKVGLPGSSDFNPHEIARSVDDSLRKLRVESIGTLFVHSLSKEMLTDENIEAMVKLKVLGKVQKIGYSGDGEDLKGAVTKSSFDDFMLTYNIIDQSNSQAIANIRDPKNIYLKVSMAQAIWTSHQLRNRLSSIWSVRKLFQKAPLPESWIDYKMRFSKFKPSILSRRYSEEFLRFALDSNGGKQFVVLGTNSPQHILDAALISNSESNLAGLEHYLSLWHKLSSPNWLPHN